VAESFESVKSNVTGSGLYTKIVDLSDDKCTRQNLLNTLIDETKDGNTIDLYIFGHGSPTSISLHGETLFGSKITSLLADARATQGSTFTFKLRLVYSCTCDGGQLNDEWMAAGAKVAVGSKCLNWMAEPMITSFMNSFVRENRSVTDATSRSFSEASAAWIAADQLLGNKIGMSRIGCPTGQSGCCANISKIESSRPIIAGDASLVFNPASQSSNFPSLVDMAWNAASNIASLGTNLIGGGDGNYKLVSVRFRECPKRFLAWDGTVGHQLHMSTTGSVFTLTHKATGGYRISRGNGNMSADVTFSSLGLPTGAERTNNIIMRQNDNIVGDEETWFLWKVGTSTERTYVLYNWNTKKVLDVADALCDGDCTCTTSNSNLVNEFNAKSGDATQVWLFQKQ
jgi:hypothetical protein